MGGSTPRENELREGGEGEVGMEDGPYQDRVRLKRVEYRERPLKNRWRVGIRTCGMVAWGNSAVYENNCRARMGQKKRSRLGGTVEMTLGPTVKRGSAPVGKKEKE